MSEASGGSTPSYGPAIKRDHTGTTYRSEPVAHCYQSERLSAPHGFFQPDYQPPGIGGPPHFVHTEQPYRSTAGHPSFIDNDSSLEEFRHPENPSASAGFPHIGQTQSSGQHVQDGISLSGYVHPASFNPYQTYFSSPHSVAEALVGERDHRGLYKTEHAAVSQDITSRREPMEKSNDISTSGENAPEYRLAAPIPLRTYMPRASYMEQAPAQTLLDPSSLQSVSVHSESHSTYVPLYTPISLSESDSTWRTSAAHGQFGTNLPVGTTGASEATIEYLTYPTAELPDHLHQHRGQPQYHTLQPHSPITFSDLPAEASDLASNAPKPAAQRSPRYRDYEPHPRVRYGLQEAEAFDDASISHEPVIADPQDISNFVPISHHGLEHAPVLTPLANSARRERDERIGNSRTAVSYQEHTFAGHNLPQLYYASHDPTYTVHHYQDASATANHSLASQTHQEPSPTWPASPLVSPAYTATSHGTFGPRLDYFGISASQPSSTESMPDLQAHQPPRARLPSKNSSPPTSLSSVSQKSEHLSGDGELLISMRPQQNDLYARTGGQDLGVGSSSKAKSSILGVRPSAGGPARMKKQTRVVDGACRSCGTRFATINLRGHPQDFSNDFDMIYYCLDCAPNQLGVSRASLEASLGLRQDDDTASSALDMPQKEGGSSQDGHAPSSGSAQTPIRVLPRGPRKRIRATDIYSPTVCDVCSRWIAHGSPLPREAGAELSFNVEIVCNLCVNKYRRCSDCGGGGGARLGVGKWRCKELFSPGRKTCSLSHARQSSMASMEYHTTSVRDIPKDEMAQLLEKCQAVFESALLSSLAVPEVLERGTAMISTYEDVISRMHDGWEEIKKLIEDDIEHESGYRRYIGLRWSTPRPRKVSSRKSTKQNEIQEDDQKGSEESAKQVIRPMMNLSGFVTGEWDVRGGTFYITISVPYSTGDHYEGSAQLINLLQKRVLTERQDMVDSLVQRESEAIPPILHAFTMLFFTPESKIMAYMESKRHMIPLQRYLERYPDTDPKLFPPHRKAYIGKQQRLEDWSVLVRRLQPPTPIPLPLSRHLSFPGPSILNDQSLQPERWS